MANTNKLSHNGMNLNDVDAARVEVLKVKAASSGLQESEKEELKQLREAGRRIV